MTMTLDEQRFVKQAIFAVAIGVSVLSALSFFVIKAALTGVHGKSGDTPVILVGGSVTFKAGGQDYSWQKDSPTEYHVSPPNAITSIAVKAKSKTDDTDVPVVTDGDSTSDVLRLDVSAGTTWQIDEYASNSNIDSGTPFLVATITPLGAAIDLNLKDAKGYLCPVGQNEKRLLYGQAQDCSDKDNFTFSKVNVSVMSNGNLLESGTLNCIDGNMKPGTCRIVFRGP